MNRLRATPAGGRMLFLLLIFALVWSVALPAVAANADNRPASITTRSGTHPGFGRLVFKPPAHTAYRISHDGDRVVVKFQPPLGVGRAARMPRNVLALHGGSGQAEVLLRPGATTHDFRLRGLVVVDVFDPIPAQPPPPAAQKSDPEPAKPAAVPASSPAPAASPAAPPVEPSPSTSKAAPPAAASGEPQPSALSSGPVALSASSASTSAAGVSFTVPFGSDVGAAAFRRGNAHFVVFDERRPLDLAAVAGTKAFGQPAVQLLPSATLIRMTIPDEMSLALSRSPEGWTITVRSEAGHPHSIVPAASDGRINLGADSPGNVIALTEPETGATLLVGTLRRTEQAVLVQRQTPQLALLPTELGVAVEPLSDNVEMRAVPAGFVLSGGTENLAISAAEPEALADAAALTRRFEFVSLPPGSLYQRAVTKVAAAAAAPALARGPRRREAAAAMIALGFGAEAEALLQVTMEQDPNEAANADTAGLRAIAALLAGRLNEADALTDPRLSGSDEIELWRAVRAALLDETSPQAAAAFAATAPLILTYPQPLRDRLLPLALETMALGGEAQAADTLLAQSGDLPGLAMAKALLKQADGATDDALAMYDALADSTDQLTHVRAGRRRLELRLNKGSIAPKEAADTLEGLLYSWRGDWRELALRERIAELRQDQGAWRAGLAMLRDAEALFPDRKAEVRERMRDMFAALLRDDTAKAVPPLELVALAEENAELLGEMTDTASLQASLADKLAELDLPDRAAPLLEKLMRNAPAGVSRAGLGVRLAS
ncbi:MAG: hypothetical protein JO227_06555, partial [Acetobacteraceae bacterium]|nr:hypothetical protein [Acetobacteraceae bacterium]